MGFVGIFTKSEVVRLWADFVNLDGSPIEPSSATIIINQGNTELVNASMTQLAVGSNVFFYDYTVSATPTEGDVFVRYRGLVAGNVVEGSDFFKIDLMKDHIKENRLGNMRLRFFPAVASDPVRKTTPGVLDYQIIDTKFDSDPADFSVIRTSKTLWFHYGSIGDFNPVKVGEA